MVENRFTDPSVDYLAGGDGTFADNDRGTVRTDFDDDGEVEDEPNITTTNDPTTEFSFEGDTVDDKFAEPSRRSLGGTSPGPGPSTPNTDGLSGTVVALLIGFVILVVGGGAAVLEGAGN